MKNKFTQIVELYNSVGWTNYTSKLERLEKALKSSEILFEYDESGDIIGLIRWITDYTTIVFIQDIIVAPNHQRMGVGTRLVRRALEQIKPYGPVQIELLTDDTPKTKSFYRAMGFAPVTDQDLVSFILDTRA
jgi:GNAT superfamily N-acetyltransferase